MPKERFEESPRKGRNDRLFASLLDRLGHFKRRFDCWNRKRIFADVRHDVRHDEAWLNVGDADVVPRQLDSRRTQVHRDCRFACAISGLLWCGDHRGQ